MAKPEKSAPLCQITLSQHPLSESLERWAETVKTAYPLLSWMVQRSDDQQTPQLKISSRLIYQAIPEGVERPLFYQAMGLRDLGPCPFDKTLQERIKLLQVPHAVQLFMANQCHYCPQVVLQMLHYGRLTSQVTLKIVDAQMFPEIAANNSIKSVPTLILDDNMRWSGQLDIAEMVGYIENQDPAQLGGETLAAMIQDGQAAQLAGMMVASQKVFPALNGLLTDEKWSIRLGAMVVMETLIETDVSLVVTYLQKFWNEWESFDSNVKGDLLYLMGETQCPAFKDPIQSLLQTLKDADGDLITAARDALDRLRIE